MSTDPLVGTSSAMIVPPISPFKTAVRQELARLVSKLEQRRAAGDDAPIDEQDMVNEVEAVMRAASDLSPDVQVPQWITDARRVVVDSALQQMVLSGAPQPERSEDDETGWRRLNDLLDVTLTFAERGYADDTLPLNCITSLMEEQSISGCKRIFRWVESRVERVTKGMQPLRGKGPILLRLSNELLRRLPKTNQDYVVFSGQILMFLNSVFPLGEKSGVNLRGNFNTGKITSFEENDEVEEAGKGMDVDTAEIEKPEEGKEVKADGAQETDFYRRFWSLQRFFTNPPALFDAKTSAANFDALRDGLSKTIDVFAEATKKERKLAGSSKTGKRKIVDLNDESNMAEYFFPKYLTSKNLLELEIGDSAFRRQVLLQALILFQYLLSFVPAERERLRKRTTNQSALPNFILTPDNETWVRNLRSKVVGELDAMEGGRRFRETVELILKREQNWIEWKLKSCVPFEKAPLPEDRSDIARSKLKALARKPKSYMHTMGNANLTRTWQRNTKSLDDFEPNPIDDDFDRLSRDWRMSTKAVQMRKSALAQVRAGPKSATTDNKAFELEAEIDQLEIKAKAIQWRAVRSLAGTNLSILSKVGTADMDKIVAALEEQRRVQAQRDEREENENASQQAKDKPNDEKEGEAVAADIVEGDERVGVEDESTQPVVVENIEVAPGPTEEVAAGILAEQQQLETEAIPGLEAAEVPGSSEVSDTLPAEAIKTASPSAKRRLSETEDDVAMDEASEAKKQRTGAEDSLQSGP